MWTRALTNLSLLNITHPKVLFWTFLALVLGHLARYSWTLLVRWFRRPTTFVLEAGTMLYGLVLMYVVVGPMLQRCASWATTGLQALAALLTAWEHYAPTASLSAVVPYGLVFLLGAGFALFWTAGLPTGVMTRKVQKGKEDLTLSPAAAGSHPVSLAEVTKLIQATLEPFAQQVASRLPRKETDPLVGLTTQQVTSEVSEGLKQLIRMMETVTAQLRGVPSAFLVTDCTNGIATRVEELVGELQDVKAVIQAMDKPMTPAVEQTFPTPLMATSSTTLQPGAASSVSCRNPEPIVDGTASEVSEEVSLEGGVNIKTVEINKSARKTKKPRRGTPKADLRKDPIPEELLTEFSQLSESQMLDRLRQRESERREAERLPDYLTEEEKAMTMDELFRKWKVERQRKRNEREALRIADFQPLGELTAEQKLLPRAQVARLINVRKNEVWAQAMREKGIQVLKCDVCSRLHTGQHQCLQTQWRMGNGRTDQMPRNIVLTQSSQGVRLRATPAMDEEHILKEYERLKALKEEVETRRKLVEPRTMEAEQTTDASMAMVVATPPPVPYMQRF